MRVLLVDSSQYAPVTPLFADCLGPEDRFFDEAPFLSALGTSTVQKVAYRFLRRPLSARAMNRNLIEAARRHQPTVVFVVKGQFIFPETLRKIKSDTGATLTCYATDDLWNPRVSSPFLIPAVREYDLYCSVRRAMIPDVISAGGRRVEYVMCGYHYNRISPGYWKENRMDVALIGGADEDRVPYADALRIPGVRLALYGGYWDRIERFRGYARGIVRGGEYLNALWSTNIAVCLVRKSNRDDHTLKTFELPASGVFTVFEDTKTQWDLFESLGQRIFFSTPEGLVQRVRYFLEHNDEREVLRKAECDLIRTGGHSWPSRFHQIMGMVEEIRGRTSKKSDDAVVV